MNIDVLAEEHRVVKFLTRSEILGSFFIKSAFTPLYAADNRIRIVFRLSARNMVSLTVDGSGPPSSQAGTSMKSRAIRVSTADPYSSPNTPFQYQRTSLLDSLRAPKRPQYRRESLQAARSGLIRQIKNAVDVEHVQELCGLHKTTFNFVSYFLYSSSGRFIAFVGYLRRRAALSLACPGFRPRRRSRV